MVNAAAGAMIVRRLIWRGKGLLGDGGGGTLAGTEDSPPGPRGWESRAPIFGDCDLVVEQRRVQLDCNASMELEARSGGPNV